MYPTEHPTTAIVLAHYRLQDDIARAEAYRAARAARFARASRRLAKSSRAAGRAQGGWLSAALRGAAGRA